MFNTKSEGIPLIRIRDIQRGYTETFTTESFDEQYRIKKGELLIGMDGMFDIARWQSDEAALNQRVCCLRMKNGENDTFIQYFVQPILKHIESGTDATTVKHISTKQINAIRIPVVSKEQKKHFEAIAQLTDKSKFDGLKSQFIEDYFNRYEPTNLGPFISVIRGVSYKPADIKESAEDGVTILRSNNISDGEINYDDLVYVSDLCVSQKQYLRSGDIVMCGSNGSKKLVGKAGLFSGEHGNTSFGAFCLGIRCNDNLSPEYLNAYFNSDMYRSIIEELGNGTNIINIRPDHITSLEIPIPNIEAQKRFVSMSRQADKSKPINQNI